MNKNIDIGGRLHSTATGNIVTGANEVFDDDKNKKQSEINTETYTLVNEVNAKLDGLSPEQQGALDVATKANKNEANLGYYVCSTEENVAAKVISDTTGYILSKGGSMKVKMTNTNTVTNATLNINSTGAKPLYYDGERASANNSWEAGETVEIYYDGTNYYANNVASGSSDGVFDVSKKYPTSGVEGGNTYTLEGALAVLNTNLPASKKKGGMSIKFIQSSDNNYVQFRCMPDEFTTDVTKWQGVDDEIKANDNLVTGKGIKAGTLEEKEYSYSEENVAGYITDKKGAIIGKLMKSGAVEWTVKNSRDILLDATIANLAVQTVREIEIDDIEENVAGYITDKKGAIIGKLMKSGAVEWTVKNSRDILLDATIANLAVQTERIDELDENTIREIEIDDIEEDVAAYITDKKKAIIAKINKDGSIDRLVDNDKDKHTVHFEDVDIDGIVNLLTDKNNKVVASINDKAEVDFYGGGGFAGEKIVEAKTWGYNKLIVSKNNIVVGGIKTDGTVKIFKAEIDNLNHEDVGVTALIKSLPIISSGLDNISISNDKRVMNLLTSVNTEHIIEIQGNDIKSKLKPCISIIDDDTIDNQIPSSRGTTVPVANQGGYFSVLLPFILSLSAKYGKKFSVGLACEGHRVGLTPMASSSDDYTELNENGRCVKWLHDNVGWNVFNHSMIAQLPVQAYYVDGINSSLAQRIISEYTGSYYSPFSFNNLCVIDRTTGKWYELNNRSQSAWVERTPTKKYAMPFYKDYDTKAWYFNREFDFEYSWGEWCKRAKELGLPYEKVIVHNGSTSSIYMANASRKYADFSIRTDGIHNYPPIPATVSRMTITAGTTGNVRNATYENSMKAEVDKCFNNHTWMVFMTHFNDPTHYNYYVDGVTYPDGVNNYPSEWILPLKYEEIEDIIGSNTNDYINHPPSRLNIQSWDEWYPAPGTKIKSLYDVLEYAIQKGVEFASPIDGWNTHGNMLNIGADRNGQTYPYDSAKDQTPYTEEEQSFLTIGADGSIRYFSK